MTNHTPHNRHTLNLNADGDWECPHCGSKWADTGEGPDFDPEDLTPDLAHTLVNRLPADCQEVFDNSTDTHVKMGYAINEARVELIADTLQDFIANVIAGLVNAGSERDAVNESEDLHTAIVNELKEWT
jgi:hypothetical protein